MLSKETSPADAEQEQQTAALEYGSHHSLFEDDVLRRLRKNVVRLTDLCCRLSFMIGEVQTLIKK